MAESFGKWIKARRRSLGFGLHRCAGKAAIDGEALRLIEVGKSCPGRCKAKTLFGLARVLRLDLAEVVERAVAEDHEYMKWFRWAEENYDK